jgi:signal transduction histidine kinase
MAFHVRSPLDRRNIEPELARLVYGSPWPSLACLTVALVTGWLLWPNLPLQMVVAWGAMIGVAHGLRLWMQYIYHSAPGDPSMADLWLRRHVWITLLIGCVWAALSVPIAQGLEGIPFFAVCTVVVGMIAGAIVANHPHIPSVEALVWPIALSVAIALVSRGDAPRASLAAFFVIIAACATVFARRLNVALVETLLSRNERMKLTADLSTRNSELADANAQLVRAQTLAESANRAKSEFLANMSHELRTPLNAIIGFSEIIKDQAFGPVGQPRYAEYAKDIYDSGGSLLQLINDILDPTKVEAGKMELQKSFVDVAVIMRRCMRLIKDRASKSNVRLKVSFDSNLPLLLADEGRLRQIAVNLLSNAIKFTPAGGQIVLSAGVDQHGAIFIRVADTGFGMSSAEIEVALERFGQTASARSRPSEGTGLGLPLTKSLVELHGGQLGIDSVPGKGTTVTVKFPPQQFPGETAHAAN